MKKRSEFQQYYNETLLPVLEEFEAERKAILRNIYIATGIIGTLGLALGGTLLAKYKMPIHALICVVIAAAICFGIGYLLTRDYVQNFKNKVIGEIVKFFDESLRYVPHGMVSQRQFDNSMIYNNRVDSYKGEDHVRGKLEATEIEFSELHAQYKTETHTKNGRHTTWHTIFKGLFFVADFNKDFKGYTVVVPDVAEKALGKWLGQALQSMNISRKGELIKLEDPEFEKLYAVYGSDQVESRYILSPALMSRIVEFQKKCGCEIALSFTRSNMYMAMTTGKNMFEPRIFRSVTDFKMAAEYYEDLRLAISIVDDMNLNTRIWTKE